MVDEIRVLLVAGNTTNPAQPSIDPTQSHITVETVDTMAEATDKLAETQFDCLVSRYDLPDRTGLDLLESVREIAPSIPVILVTDGGSEAIASQAISAGVTDYLQVGSGAHSVSADRLNEVLADRITEAVEQEQSRRERQSRLDAIESAREGISILDSGGQFLYVNEAYADLYGYDRSELIGEHWELLYPDDEVDHIRSDVLPAVEERGQWRGKTTGRRSDGSTFIEDHTLATTDDGKLVCTVRDITDRIARERQFEAIFNNTYTFVGLLEPDGTLLEANETALAFGGLDREEVVGKPVWEAHWFQANEEARTAAREGVEQAQDGTLYRDEIRVQGAEREAVIDFSVRPVTDEQDTVQFLVPEGRDVTQRKRYTRKLETLIENLPGMVYRCQDERGWPMDSVRGTVEDLTGYEPSELESGDVAFGEDVIHAADRDNVWEEIQDAIESRESFEVTYRIVTKDDETKWVWERGQGVYTTEDEPEAIEGFISDITEQKRTTEKLREEREFVEQTLDTLDDVFYVVGRDGELRRWNYRLPEVTGYTEDEIVEMRAVDFVPEDERERIADAIEETLATGTAIVESRLRTAEGEEIPYEFTGARLTDTDGNLIGLVGTGRDITERKQYEERMAGLNDMLVDLMDAEDKRTVCTIATEAAQTTLDLPISMVVLFDDEQQALRPVGRTRTATRELDDKHLLDQGGPVWDVYTSGETVVLGCDEPIPEAVDIDESITQIVVYPLGRHGVFVRGLRGESETDIETDFTKTVGENLRSALNRVERESLLMEGKELIAERNRELDKIRRVNDIIRTIDRELVDATSREEIEQTVCRELAETGPYQFVWFGTYDSQEERVVIRAQAGQGGGYLDAVSLQSNDGQGEHEPTTRAVQTKEPQIVERIRTEPPYEPWRETALKRGFGSIMALPIVYRDRLYGVLSLYTDSTELVDDFEQEVVTELGENIAHAINAIETRRALVSDTVVELELVVPVSQIPLFDVVRQHPDTRFDLKTLVPAQEGTYRAIIIVDEADPSELRETMEQSTVFREMKVVANTDESCRVNCHIRDDSFITWLLDQGAIPQSVTVTSGSGRVTVQLPGGDNVRRFVDSLQSRYEEGELLARRQLDYPEQKQEAFTAELEEKLTTRQQEVLQLAYWSGYFNSPRDQTASELAESLDITQPTFTDHLRASQRKLLESLYSNGNTR